MAKKKLTPIEKENIELKEMIARLLSEVNQSKITRIGDTPEENILGRQIDHYAAISRERPLVLDEIRALDLLIKNKRLFKEEKPIEADYKKVPLGTTEADLLRIAGNGQTKTHKKTRKGSKS